MDLSESAEIWEGRKGLCGLCIFRVKRAARKKRRERRDGSLGVKNRDGAMGDFWPPLACLVGEKDVGRRMRRDLGANEYLCEIDESSSIDYRLRIRSSGE